MLSNFLEVFRKNIVTLRSYFYSLAASAIWFFWSNDYVSTSLFFLLFTILFITAISIEQLRNRNTDLLCQMPLERKDPTFIVDRSGRIHQSKGYTGRLFEKFNISQLNQILDEENCEKILDFSGKKQIADNQTLECFSETFEKWFQIQFKPTLDKKNIYIWLIDIGHRKRLDLSLSAIRRFSQEVIDNINVLIRNNDVYDRLAGLMLKEGFEGIFIIKTTANSDMVGYAFKLTGQGINKSKKITVRNDSPISILMSRKTGKLTYAVKPASLSQSDFEGQYPFDEKVKAFLGFPIVNFLNYHEGEISIIAYNKKQGIATYDHLLMETLVNTARIVSYLMDLAISNHRILNDLETAHETQSQLLPKKDPQIPGLDIAGESIYCDQTGGDYYDYFYSSDETGNAFRAVIADVSGHGIAAALIMMAARALLKSLVPQTDKSSQIITDLNRLLCQGTLESGNFMTMMYFMIDPADKSITWVRAGHEPIVCYDPALNQFTELKGSGIAIGLDEEYRYEEFTRDSLADDQIFLVVTDGLWEARNEKGQMLAKDLVKEVIRKHSFESSKVIKDAVIAVVREFIGSAPLEDDLTIIVVKLDNTD
jgi:serine phosphatase RsbU (regulator of sigma subunit)